MDFIANHIIEIGSFIGAVIGGAIGGGFAVHIAINRTTSITSGTGSVNQTRAKAGGDIVGGSKRN